MTPWCSVATRNRLPTPTPGIHCLSLEISGSHATNLERPKSKKYLNHTLNHKLSSITVISSISKPFFLVPMLTLVSFVLCCRSLLGFESCWMQFSSDAVEGRAQTQCRVTWSQDGSYEGISWGQWNQSASK